MAYLPWRKILIQKTSTGAPIRSSDEDARLYQVAIVGGGPTGLMLAYELALAGVDAAIVERRETQELIGMRAGGLHMRTLEVLDQRGLGDRFVAEGERFQMAPFHDVMLDVSDTPTRRNYFLALPQKRFEAMLADRVAELGVPFYRGCELSDFSQSEEAVETRLADGRQLRSTYLVGCDGARSAVRKLAGIEFAGWEPTKSWLIAEAQWREEPKWGLAHDAHGTHALGQMDEAGKVRIVLVERALNRGDEPALDEVKTRLVEVYGTDFGIHDATWISRFNDRCRQAVAYRQGRVLLAGDAAHIHPPMGGQGLNMGVQDAINLGWKLAQVLQGVSPDTLLDTYQAERHPVADRVLRNAMADVALQRRDPRSVALGERMAELAVMEAPRKFLVADRSGLAIKYDLENDHPLVGRRIPDLDIVVGGEKRRIYDYLHRARPVLFSFAGGADPVLVPGSDRVQRVSALCDAPWDLPVIGRVPTPDAVLLRPDGYVAWAGSLDDERLRDAMGFWFGGIAA